MMLRPLDMSEAVFYHTGKFPPTSLDSKALLEPMTEAADSLARYDTKISGMVNSELLLAPLRKQDAVSSSRMEGTISTMENLYLLEAENDAGANESFRGSRNDDVETLLYSRALLNAQRALAENHPLNAHLIRAAHQRLLSSGRGAHRHPGSYKTEQNFVGDERRGKIYFVPIPPEQLAPAMDNLMSFINGGGPHRLLRTAIAHVEFEALHPFEDGNGRIGRMLITLMLWKLKLLSQPHFFVSGYFEEHKDEYIARMRAVSSHDDWTGWAVFFMRAMHEQAAANIRTVDGILKLYSEMRERFRTVLNSQFHDKALDFVFERPVFRNDMFVEKSGIPTSSARALSRKMVEQGLLRTMRPAAGQRAAVYAFMPLLELLRI